MGKLVDMGNRGDLTNEQWEKIAALLPKSKTKRSSSSASKTIGRR
ncbi:MAG: hypothetical protein ACYC2P_10505 [Paludibacteraceae bacterium]